MNGQYPKFIYFELGSFIAKNMLGGILHTDMQWNNIGWSETGFCFRDFANIKRISVPDELSSETVLRLTLSLIPPLKPDLENFACISYFRAGFTAYGGVMGHMIFSNAANIGLNSLKHVCVSDIRFTYDANYLYTTSFASAIKEWNKLPLMLMHPFAFPTLYNYHNFDIRKKVSLFTRYYLDNLYYCNCYNLFSQKPMTESSITDLIFNMAMSAYHHGSLYTAYGLFRKVLNIKNRNVEFDSKCTKNIESILSTGKLSSLRVNFIDNHVRYDLFEFLWILDDLAKTLPDDIILQLNNDKK